MLKGYLILILFFVFILVTWDFKVSAIADTDQQNIIIKYQKYLLLQIQLQNAQQNVQNSITDYNKAVADLIKKEKQPEGTTITVNLDNNTIVFVPPDVPNLHPNIPAVDIPKEKKDKK